MLESIQAHPEWKSRTAHRGEALYIIPVVVHVMHTGGVVGSIYNPSDAQIINTIAYLNQVYGGTYSGMTAPFGGSSVVNMEIQFALAQRTPSCGATNGIDRVDASGLSGYVANGVNSGSAASDLALKDLSRWNPANYYNIWVVNKIDGADGTVGQFIAGYAQFAGGPSNTDGTVMLATQFVAGEKTLPHEIGHALNLYHTFQGSNNDTQCPSTTNCTTTGDLCCDTDPVSRNYNVGTGLFNFSCRSGTNSCTSTAYTINTESNFMGYTNCYKLFTNDQKARVQAAMLLASRSSLVDPGNLALVPCGTFVNLSLPTYTVTEDNSGTTTGCRTYRDYNFQMTIGAAPSATATATLTYSGTGVKGLDYEVTTNGNFASPSNTLTFASGSTVAQSFIVRVFNDANVESAETAIIDFTLNNGGGNAVKGTTTPTLTFNISDNDVAPLGASSGIFSVGALSVQGPFAPFIATMTSQRTQIIYRASELNAAGISAGTISALQLYVATKGSTRPFNNLTLKMANTSTNYLIDAGLLYPASGLTTVYTNAAYSTTAGWNNFTLSTPFVWNGTSNVVLEICYDNVTASSGGGQDQLAFYLSDGAANQRNFFFQDNLNCAGTFVAASVGYINADYKPSIRFNAANTGTVIETVSTSTGTLHMTNGSSDYFYSNNGRLLARLNNISASLGCVTTSLPNAGSSWTNYLGGQRSSKVFAVTPTTNGATTSYSISLYFANAELGGKTPATLRIAKTTAATIAAANSSNTILVTPTMTTLGTGTTVYTGNFTGFSLFFLVDANVTLPVNLVDFSGFVNNELNSVLQWETASEQNNKEFDVEISRDGNNFTWLGTVASKGNSASLQQYQFIQVKPQSGVNFYRLKQKDLDGKHSYSKIISLNIQKPLVKAFVYPVPARDILTINFGDIISKARIEIFGADLKTIEQLIISELTLRKDISIASLAPGVYFLRITVDEKQETLRFVKQ